MPVIFSAIINTGISVRYQPVPIPILLVSGLFRILPIPIPPALVFIKKKEAQNI